jgi:cytochrome P450
MLAGHETTANTISWTLFELTRYPHLQDKLRAEIEEKILEKGSDMLTEHDYESMPYLTAIMKVRLHGNFLWLLLNSFTGDSTFPSKRISPLQRS